MVLLGGHLPPPDVDAWAFHAMVIAFVKHSKTQPSHFVKKLDKMPKINLSPSMAWKKALDLVDRSLINQFTGNWPSPKSIAIFLQKNWVPLINGSLSDFFYGRGFYAFLFEQKEDRDLMFHSDPYFLGARGMYLNKLTLDFSPKNDVPSTVPM